MDLKFSRNLPKYYIYTNNGDTCKVSPRYEALNAFSNEKQGVHEKDNVGMETNVHQDVFYCA